MFDYSKMIYDNDETESNFDDSIKEKISLYTYVDIGIYDLALTEICVNIAKAAFVYRDWTLSLKFSISRKIHFIL